MATPHVAGAAALLLEAHSSWTPAEVKMAVRNTSLDLGYDVNTQGYGRLQVLPAAQLPHAPPIASITTSGLLASTTDISGTATSDYFQSYALYLGEGMDPGSWTVLKESTTPVSDSILYAGFDPSGLPDGYHTLRLDVTDTDALVSQDRVLLEIDNVQIATPWNDDILRKGDAIEIRGSLLGGAEFQNYVLEYGLGHDPSAWSVSGITLASGGTVPVVDGLLATWDTSAIGAGDSFTLRLTVSNDWGQSTEFVRDLYLDPTLKPGWPQRIPWDFEPDPFKTGLETASEFFSYLPRSSEADPVAPEGALVTVSTGEPGFSTQESGLYYWGGNLEPVVSDVDNDGHDEIVVYTGGVPPEIRVYRDDGSLYWSVPIGTTAVAGGNLHIPLVADINKDGFKEIIAYQPISDPSQVYAFSHDGSLLPGWPVSVPQDFKPMLLAADLDQDGDKEIVIQGNGSNQRAMVVIGGDGQIVAQWPLALKMWSASIESSPAVGNLDADPELEIVSAGPSKFAGYDSDTGEWNNTGVIHVYNTDGSEVPGWPVYTDGIIFSSPAVGDIDQDGQNEIVVGLMYASDIFPDCRYGGVYAFDRTGNVLPGWPFEKCYNFWSSPSLGDLDGDGDLEIATSRLGTETYVLHHDGSLAAGWPQATGWTTTTRRSWLTWMGTALPTC